MWHLARAGDERQKLADPLLRGWFSAKMPQSTAALERDGPALPSRAADHEIDVPAAAARAHEPLLPVEKRQVGTVASDLFGQVGLDLMGARLAPHDQGQMGIKGGAERRRGPEGSLYRRWIAIP